MSELAYNYVDAEDDYYEIIEGVKTMPPSAGGNHNTIAFNIAFDLKDYAVKHGAAVLPDVDVYIDGKNVFRPDLCVVCNRDLIGKDFKVHGVPDLCVEILSRSTMKKDIGIKKDIYEAAGVREYWIVDPWAKGVSVYQLVDGKYQLDNVYQIFSDDEIAALTDTERAEIRYEIPVGIFPGLEIDVRRVFKWWFD